MKRLAIIPARGGSKRIRDKNIRLFAGKPIISYPIKAALSSGLFDRVIVSTDSRRIAATASEFGAEVPFFRPSELASDFTPTAPVIRHALKYFEQEEEFQDYFCCIYATAVFVRQEDLIRGQEILREKNATMAFSVSSYPGCIFRALRIDESGRLTMFWPEHEKTRSNDLPAAYQDAGQFYWGDSRRFLQQVSMYGKDAVPVYIPRYLVHDIDTPEDWEVAEKFFFALREKTER